LGAAINAIAFDVSVDEASADASFACMVKGLEAAWRRASQSRRRRRRPSGEGGGVDFAATAVASAITCVVFLRPVCVRRGLFRKIVINKGNGGRI
jgi:hypothetical protein